MAIGFLQAPYFSKPYVLTSEARSIGVSTDADSVAVSLTCKGETFFSVDLYAFDGVIELYDPGALVEDFFIRKDLICETVTVKFGSMTRDITFLYCEDVMPPTFNPARDLLLSANARRVHADSQITVAALPKDPYVPFVIKAVGHDSDGNVSSVQYANNINLATAKYTIWPVAQIVSIVTGKNASMPIENPLADVLFFSVKNGGGMAMFYITPSPAFLTFRFRNIFNVPELLDVEGVMEMKSETSRENARCSGDIVQYDRRTDRTYQITTGPLPSDEVESLVQLISSHSVQIYVDGAFYDVVIDDHTCEDSTDDESLTVIKFTWRFKGRRPVIFNSSMLGISSRASGVFSDEYSPEYE